MSTVVLRRVGFGLIGWLSACVDTGGGDSVADSDPQAPTGPFVMEVTVTVDGEPAAGARVMQAGTEEVVTTDAAGLAAVTVDPAVPGTDEVIAGFPTAWNGGVVVHEAGPVTIALLTFSTVDNPAYEFLLPGETEEEPVADKCAHCHLSIHEGWRLSAHRTSAQNVAVQGVYQGADFAASEVDCGGRGAWGELVEPGTGEPLSGCRVAAGVTETTAGSGLCADCHAPAIGGAVLAGHDLLEARGMAYADGVSCDVCHKVSTVMPGAAPGIAGWLTLLRPSDPSPSRLLGLWHPLQFGPYLDVVNPYMGAVQRDHYRESGLCGGCHQLDQAVLVSGQAIDLARWPSGFLPIQGTYAEWAAAGEATPCQGCHMPVLSGVGNSADLNNEFALTPDSSAGWERPIGAVRAHSDIGPRQPDSGILDGVAAVEVVSTVEAGTLTAEVTVTNVGAGHALPTGEPFRNLVLLVEAECAGVPLVASGGDVVPPWGGAGAINRAPDPLDRFPTATPGSYIRLARTTGMLDYIGPGPFGDGTFTAAEKGLPALDFVGEVTVLAVSAEGYVTVDRPDLMEVADTAFLWSSPDDLAGTPGFGFAKVLVDAAGEEMVPHFAAVDVKSDNRLGAGVSYTSTHRFVSPCATPDVHATLGLRAFPPQVAAKYGWAREEVLLEEGWN